MTERELIRARLLDETLTERASPARMYDYYLGGIFNFDVDRRAADDAVAIHADIPLIAKANRAFLGRAVQQLCQRGIDQFLDLGSGIPTVGNVHEIAQTYTPDARVVYIDIDPVAVLHSIDLLDVNPNATCIQADIRHIEAILDHPEVIKLLDFSRPIAILLVAVLQFITNNEEVGHIFNVLRRILTPGSYVVVSHPAFPELPLNQVDQIKHNETAELYAKSATALTVRSEEQIAQFFTQMRFIPPGLVYVPAWNRDHDDTPFADNPKRSAIMGGVAMVERRK
ncbi:MAG: SAM-dependent methyltransferase [Chloroflexota bacterium]